MSTRLPLLPEAECRPVAPEGSGPGALMTQCGALPLRALDVQARIDGLTAHTTVTQTFVNTLEGALEATYIFPLPDRAAVTRFRLEVAGRVVEGQLQEREKAREAYDQAIREGRRAAIAEEERAGVFTIRVGNLPPGETATVRLSLTGPVPVSDGEATYRFPLVVAPRYVPGAPLPGPHVGDGTHPDTTAVPDASRITPPVLLPGYPNPVRLSLAVEVAGGGLPVRDFRSSLHAVEEGRGEGGAMLVAVRPEERVNRDFVLRWRVDGEQVGSSLALQADGDGEEGTFVLTLVPPAGTRTAGRPRDLVFVLDRSGSMGGWKMTAARRALGRMIETLTDRDRFSVLAFDNTVETPPVAGAALAAATYEARTAVLRWLEKIDARGGTEMAQPLDAAVSLLASRDAARDRVLVLVTDGQVGNEDQILRVLAQRLHGLRVFALGIDQAVNDAFLRRLATAGGGYAEVVESEGRLDEVMDRVHRRIGTPVLTGLKLEPAGLAYDPATVVPGRLPDLFAGTPLVVCGRYRGRGAGGLAVQGRDEAGQPWSATVAGYAASNPALTQAWARGQVRELEDRYAAGTEDRAALEPRIVGTSLRFGVLSRFTAFVAVDVQEVVNPGGQVQRIVQPVEFPAGWEERGLRDRMVFSAPQALFASPPCWDSSTLGAQPSGVCESYLYDFEMDEMAGPPAAPAPRTPPPPAPPRAKRRSWFGRKEAGKDKAAALDLTAYRQRTRELLDRLQAKAGDPVEERRRELGVLAVALETLVDDLRSVGAGGADLAALEKLLTALRSLPAAAAEGPVASVWQQACDVLRAFVGEPAAPRRKGFWK